MSYREEFETLLNNTKLSDNATSEEHNKIMQPLMQFISEKIPGQLYKFRECSEYSFDAFAKDEIWLSKASLFNDLHDSLLFFDKQAIIQFMDKVFLPENVHNVLEYIKSGQEPIEKMGFLNSEFRQQVFDYFKVMDEKNALTILEKVVPDFNIFLDTFLSILQQGIRNRTKMACLSGNIASPLMWAHYANNHKGFAIGYDFRGGDISQCSYCPNRSCSKIKLATIYPMIYSDKRFDATAYGMWEAEQYIKKQIGAQSETNYCDSLLAMKIALHKSSDWTYEDEWRIICSTPDPFDDQKDRYPISKKPVAIYFGCQIPNIYREMLTHIADEKGIEKYQMYVKNDSQKYELDYRPI